MRRRWCLAVLPERRERMPWPWPEAARGVLGAWPCLRPAPGALRQEGWRRRVVVEQQEQEQEPVRKLPQAPGWALFPRRAIGWGRRCRSLLATAVLRVLTLLAGPKWWLGAGAVVVALVARRG